MEASATKHVARAVVPQVRSELRQQNYPVQLISAVVFQARGVGLGSVLEVFGQGELVPAEAQALADLAYCPARGRTSIFAYNRLLFVPVYEASQSVILLDLSGQTMASVSCGPQRALVMLFKADDAALIQDFALSCEQFLNERG